MLSQEYASQFYASTAWKKARAAYAKSRGGLCERCMEKGLYRAGVIVHHKIHITPENINDPSVVLNWDNLQLVCRDCHAEIHGRLNKRYKLDELGRVINT